MGHLNLGHSSVIQACGNGNHLLYRYLVTLGVHTVAQAHIVQSDFIG
jgi:hypothetical protein